MLGILERGIIELLFASCLGLAAWTSSLALDLLRWSWTGCGGCGLAAHAWTSGGGALEFLFESCLGLAVPALDFQRGLGLALGGFGLAAHAWTCGCWLCKNAMASSTRSSSIPREMGTTIPSYGSRRRHPRNPRHQHPPISRFRGASRRSHKPHPPAASV